MDKIKIIFIVFLLSFCLKSNAAVQMENKQNTENYKTFEYNTIKYDDNTLEYYINMLLSIPNLNIPPIIKYYPEFPFYDY